MMMIVNFSKKCEVDFDELEKNMNDFDYINEPSDEDDATIAKKVRVDKVVLCYVIVTLRLILRI